MERKHFLIPILLIFLSSAFVIISFLYFINGRKSANLLRRKFKLGGLILTLTATPFVFNACTCYKPEDDSYAEEVTNQFNIISDEVKLSNDTTIEGWVRNYEGKDFSYRLSDADSGYNHKKETLIPIDGVFDNYIENFKIKLSSDFPTGNFILYFYDMPVSIVTDSSRSIANFNISIKE